MEIRPDYYDDFCCIAGACRHNCCIGWEIDIDDDSLGRYAHTTGALGERLRENIAAEPCAHFILSEDERCPFLNGDNLCALILQGGEEMLCQICREHPRFYNERDGVLEQGLGLCCEEVARLILAKTEPVRLLSDDGTFPQDGLYREREVWFSLLQDRTQSLDERVARLLARVGAPSPVGKADWVAVYKSLERLDPAWEAYLDGIGTLKAAIPAAWAIPCEQLLCYFLYRHASGGAEDGRLCERVQLAVLSCHMIVSLCRSLDELVEVARMYSSEIEYSDENVEILLQELQEYNDTQRI